MDAVFRSTYHLAAELDGIAIALPPHPSAVNPARRKIGNPTVPLQNRKNSPAAAGAPRKAAIG